jgi:hypothetical protein
MYQLYHSQYIVCPFLNILVALFSNCALFFDPSHDNGNKNIDIDA